MVFEVQVIPIKTSVIKLKSNLVKVVLEAIKKQGLEFKDNDILVLSSKIVSFAKGRVIRLSAVAPSEKAKIMAERYDLSPAFAELILQRADRILGGVKKAVLTLNNSVFTVNAGIDNKNAPKGFVVLWPKNPQLQAEHIRKEIFHHIGRKVGVLIVDSTVAPLRWGTRGLAIGVAGFEPVKDYRQTRDLFKKEIAITLQAVADDLASAAHVVMGEAAEQTPMAIIRDAPVTFTEKVDAEMMKIAFDNCAYMGAFKLKRSYKIS